MAASTSSIYTTASLPEKLLERNAKLFSSFRSARTDFRQCRLLIRCVQQLGPDAPSVPPTPAAPAGYPAVKWSKGDGPGEYGGPPLDMRLRKTWGGSEPDPLEDSASYIWNTKWRESLDAKSKETPSESLEKSEKEDEKPSAGFLSLGRAFDLDRVDLDLSAELMRPPKGLRERAAAASAAAAAPTPSTVDEAGNGSITEKKKYAFAPTRGEAKKWASAKKFFPENARDLSVVSESAKGGDREEILERERKEYQELKRFLLLLTTAFGVGGAAMAYAYYSPAIALSYGLGSVGSLMYLRMLGNSVEAAGQGTLDAALKGAIGQPRILVPVVLVMAYNRWNEVLVPGVGALELQLLPMLLGFFTYKGATMVQTIREVLPALGVEPRNSSISDSSK